MRLTSRGARNGFRGGTSKKKRQSPAKETARDESLVIPLDGGLGKAELVARRLERIVFENCGVDYVPAPPSRIGDETTRWSTESLNFDSS
jgi:hypothetical protein